MVASDGKSAISFSMAAAVSPSLMETDSVLSILVLLRKEEKSAPFTS